MKKQVLLWALVLGFTAAPVALSARSIDQQYLDTYQDRAGPVPVSIRRPVVSMDYAGHDVDLVFLVNERGRPGRIISPSPAPRELVKTLAAAVERWEFTPVLDENGKPIPVKVRLPVSIVPPKSR